MRKLSAYEAITSPLTDFQVNDLRSEYEEEVECVGHKDGNGASVCR